jgi:hypothetical protein
MKLSENSMRLFETLTRFAKSHAFNRSAPPELSPASKALLASARFTAAEINQAFAEARRDLGSAPWADPVDATRLSPASVALLKASRFTAADINQAFAEARRVCEAENAKKNAATAP